MLSTDVVTILAATAHQRIVMELACDWRKAQVDVDPGEPQTIDCADGRVIILGFPAAALPVLTRGNIPYELYDEPLARARPSAIRRKSARNSDPPATPDDRGHAERNGRADVRGTYPPTEG